MLAFDSQIGTADIGIPGFHGAGLQVDSTANTSN
jgi:hypothetical protein